MVFPIPGLFEGKTVVSKASKFDRASGLTNTVQLETTVLFNLVGFIDAPMNRGD